MNFVPFTPTAALDMVEDHVAEHILNKLGVRDITTSTQQMVRPSVLFEDVDIMLGEQKVCGFLEVHLNIDGTCDVEAQSGNTTTTLYRDDLTGAQLEDLFIELADI